MRQFFSPFVSMASIPALAARFSLAIFIILGLCPPAKAADIAVTLPPLAGLAAMLDPTASTLCLLKSGADPHHFQLSPRSIESLRQSKLLIRASMDDRSWPLPPEHRNTLDLWPKTSHGWLSPRQVRHILPTLATALIRLHPEREAEIKQHLTMTLQQTDAISHQWQLALANVAAVIMQHPSWQPLMQELNVPVLAILESGKHEHETGPHHLEHALVALNQHPDTWLLADLAHSPRPLDWLARHADQQPRQITLDPLGRCGETWIQLMQQNLERLKSGPRH